MFVSGRGVGQADKTWLQMKQEPEAGPASVIKFP